MKYIRLSLAILLVLGGTGKTMAAVTTEEAKQLGTTLTALGAEKAANKDGSIPEFTNIPITPPADYPPGSGQYPDPFKDEKPLFSIDAGNMDRYADKLSEGTKLLLKRWPSYRIDVYPTHRTGTYNQWIGENTIRNATNAKLVDDGMGVEGAYGGPPFPIPKSALEVLWNSFLLPRPSALENQVSNINMDASGRMVLYLTALTYFDLPYYDPERTSLDGLSYNKWVTTVIEPAREAGGKTLCWFSINYAKQDLLVWTYTLGQRRVRLAPDLKYDGLAGPGGGTFDEIYTYSGPPDLYDWKLVGKQEMYVPYNAYRAAFGDPEKVITPQHFNPDALRWELHRVWVVDGTLKPGKKHTMPRRIFYVDEDTWAILLSDSYDNDGNLYRIGQPLSFPMYEGGVSFIYNTSNLFYNIPRDSYALLNHLGEPGNFAMPVPKRPASETQPDTMGGSGIR